MASQLREIVAWPRKIDAETGLDFCYVTDFIIAASGPSQEYPRLAYRTPLNKLKAYLDAKHGRDWAIWEFRAEGTGYPDDAVEGRVRHYPWPDHHPPPFRLVPMITASMRNWLHGGELDVQPSSNPSTSSPPQKPTEQAPAKHDKRVVVIHCKAGKGRSGTISCSYLISEEGWTAKDALARFTERRMQQESGPGVSIPSQLRWVSYVDRWTHHGKKYVDRPIEIVEIHAWGLRKGFKVFVEGFVEDGKKMHVFHTFGRKEREVVEAGAPPERGWREMLYDLATAGAASPNKKVPDEVELADEANAASVTKRDATVESGKSNERKRQKMVRKGAGLIQRVLQPSTTTTTTDGVTAKAAGSTASIASEDTTATQSSDDETEPGGLAVIFKPTVPIRIPNSDVNIAVERSSKMYKNLSMGLLRDAAHVWFNAFFEGQGPEQGGRADDSGVFTTEWEAMDGVMGTSFKVSRALDKMSIVWRVADGGEKGEDIVQPGEGEPVPQVAAADWREGSAEVTAGEGALDPLTSQGSSLESAGQLKAGGDGETGDSAERVVPASEPRSEGLAAETVEGSAKK